MFQMEPGEWPRWISYFEHNAVNLMPIDWYDPYELTDEEAICVSKSIQQFQLGESSEGKHVIAKASRYAKASGDKGYLPALRLFIKEEHRHSDYLVQFLYKYGLPLLQKHPVDSVFRLLRHNFSLELSVMAMLTAEIIAVPYYRALHDATKSPLLRQICRQVLHDEIQHLRFQAETLNVLSHNHLRIQTITTETAQRGLLTGAIFLVWQQHHSVFSGSGYTFAKFWRNSWRHYSRLFLKPKAQYVSITRY